MSSEDKARDQQMFDNGQLVMKQRVLSIVQGQLESIQGARKDTTGLGMIEHVIKMILFEVERL